MGDSQIDKIASVSTNPPYHTQPTPKKEDCDTDNIISLVSKLCFNIDEQSKAQFFEDLEGVLEEEFQKDESENNYSDLIDFFIKHVSDDGSISA